MAFPRKSVKVGALRFNLSKSGASISPEITSMRFGVRPRGNCIRVGSGALFYSAALSPTAPAKLKPSPEPQPDLTASAGTHASLKQIESENVYLIVAPSSREFLEKLNSKRQKVRL